MSLLKMATEAILLFGLAIASSTGRGAEISAHHSLYLKSDAKTAELVEISRSIQQLSVQERMNLANSILSRSLPLLSPESDFPLRSILGAKYSIIDQYGLFLEIMNRNKHDPIMEQKDIEKFTAYRVALANTTCRGSDPPFPFPELEHKYVRYETIEINTKMASTNIRCNGGM
jgi:hypothetical protein